MERNQVIAIAVVVAAVVLFGLKVWSDRAAESDLTAGNQAAARRLARAGGAGSDDAGTWSGSDAASGRPGRPGEPGAARLGGLAGGGAGGSRLGGGSGGGSGMEGRGGSANLVRGAAAARSGVLGAAGAASRSAGGEGSGASIAGGGASDGSGHLGPKVQQKNNLVEFLSQQPPGAPQDLANAKDANGEDVALKVDHTDDIGRQGGQDQNVQQGDDGNGVKITDRGKIEFPNYANGDAATIQFSIKPDWSGSDQTDNALLEIRQEHEWANRLELVKNGEFLRFIVTPDSGQEADISVRINDWQPGDQHDVRASYGDGKTYLFIDGNLVGSVPYSGNLQFAQGTPMFLGGDHTGSNYQGANAQISDFILKNSATTQ
jgi:hypothetical protein